MESGKFAFVEPMGWDEEEERLNEAAFVRDIHQFEVEDFYPNELVRPTAPPKRQLEHADQEAKRIKIHRQEKKRKRDLAEESHAKRRNTKTGTEHSPMEFTDGLMFEHA